MQRMKEEIKEEVRRHFSGDQEGAALELLQGVHLQHVMAESQTNLDNTWLAMIKLSKGDLGELMKLAEDARRDFRDVIYQASLQ